MKKIYLLSFALFGYFFSSQAQSVFELKDLTGTGLLVPNASTINKTTNSGLVTAHGFEIKNISVVTQTIMVRRYDDLLNTVTASTDEAIAYFCFGAACFPASVFSSSIVLAPGATAALTTDLEEASVIGQSQVRYNVYDANVLTDAVTFTLRYNGPVSVKENTTLSINVSESYPNPAVSKSYINVSVNSASDVKVTVNNSLGAIVSVKMVDLLVGKNTIVIDNENLPTGLYFVTINKGSQSITKKITISK